MKEVISPALSLMLPLAVYSEIPHMARFSFERRLAIIQNAPEVLGSQGDILQFGGGKKGEVAKVFAALARGLAICALQPGGVTFAGTHYGACPKCARPTNQTTAHCHCGHDLAVAYYPEGI
jgi:hypothetical protein